MGSIQKKEIGIWSRLTMIGFVLAALFLSYNFIATGGSWRLLSLKSKSYVVKISGANGLRFSGEISVTTSDDSVSRQIIDGIVPETFQVMGKTVSVSFRKCEENGLLRVMIAENSGIAAEAVTTRKYGSIDIGAN